jgi:DNA replication protein DnaC
MKNANLLDRVNALRLYGIASHWDEVSSAPWIPQLLDWEEHERTHRSLERRLKASRMRPFKALSDFDWQWPKQCDRKAIDACMQLSFMENATNIILSGPNGVGKTTIACNIAHHAILQGYQAIMVTAGQMLNELAASESAVDLKRKIKRYLQPHLLVIDEVGYLSYSNRHADLMFEIISGRYQEKPTIVTTNKAFSEWNEIFPNASCVVSLIDRLVHHSEIITIDADSYRLKEAKEKNEQRQKTRAKEK